MLETFRSPETKQKSHGLKDRVHSALGLLGLVEKEHLQERPAPLTVIIQKDGESVPRTFSDEDTHLVFCEEKPEYSFIMQVAFDEDGEVADAEYIFDNPKVMAEMKKLGFPPEYETPEEAEYLYNLERPADEPESNVHYI
jgi:hypothetical protein